MDRRIAIILHGPPAIGKTTIANDLVARLGAILISLDGGWGEGEVRYRGGPGRYADLTQAVEPVLVVELGCGEPADLSFPGASRGASEWITVLRNTGRELFPFLLTADPSEVPARLEHRLDEWIRLRRMPANNKFSMLCNFLGVHFLYANRHPLVTFPDVDGFYEQALSTTGRNAGAVVDEIISTANLSAFVKL